MSSMAKSGEIGNRESQESLNFPRDLLHRFMFNNHLSQKSQQNSEEDEGELELSLGLSLNGRFGVDPKAQKLTRSSSIPEFLTNHFENDNNETSCGFSVPLVRTSSLPTETEEEWRKRKELQTLRRMEAKRKRSEKQRSLKVARSRTSRSAEEFCAEEDKREEVVNGNSNSPSYARGTCVLDVRGEKAVDLQQVSNGSPPGSGGSSRMSEIEGQSAQGTNKSSEAKSPSSVQSTIESEQGLRAAPSRLMSQLSGNFAGVAKEPLPQPGNPTLPNNGVQEPVKDKLEDMPCVSTTGDGPNGRRIEGFLYRYKKGEEVRIVCVCHGSFLSPAEFVKHAGGGDVAHPLKHIVVNPSPPLL